MYTIYYSLCVSIIQHIIVYIFYTCFEKKRMNMNQWRKLIFGVFNCFVYIYFIEKIFIKHYSNDVFLWSQLLHIPQIIFYADTLVFVYLSHYILHKNKFLYNLLHKKHLHSNSHMSLSLRKDFFHLLYKWKSRHLVKSSESNAICVRL